MSQLLARHTTGTIEQALTPAQAMRQLLPAQSTPPKQPCSPQVMSHDEALPQSTTPLLQLLYPQSTRQGMPAAQCGVQSAVVQVMTHTSSIQLPPAALHVAATQGG